MAEYTGLDGLSGNPLVVTLGGFTVSAGAVALPAGSLLAVAMETNALQYRDVQLTNAQMLAVRASPITLVASPGADRTILVERVHMVCDAAAGVYSESTDNLVVEYSGGTDIIVVETTGFIDQASVEVRNALPAVALFTPIAAEAVQLFNSGDGEFGGGNVANTFSVRVWYREADMVAFS